jgi:hypothetical protein
LFEHSMIYPMKDPTPISSNRFSRASAGCERAYQWRLQAVASTPWDSVGFPQTCAPRRAARWVRILLALFGIMAWMAAPEALMAADPPSYTFKPKNESGDPAKGWYIHLPPPFTAADVIIKDSGGKILKDVRVVDRGRRTGVTVFFETNGAGVPDKATDEIKLTLTKPLGKTGASGFRDKDGVKGVPIGEVTWDPLWTDNQGATGGTKPKEEKKKPQRAPSEEGDDTLVMDGEALAESSEDEISADFEGVAETDSDQSGPVNGNDYPYSSEETNDELFSDWADGVEWDNAAGDVEPDDGLDTTGYVEPIEEPMAP